MRGQYPVFDKAYCSMNAKKDHSFIIVSKHNKIKKRYLVYNGTTGEHSYVDLDEQNKLGFPAFT
jgi:hypothetical protein